MTPAEARSRLPPDLPGIDDILPGWLARAAEVLAVDEMERLLDGVAALAATRGTDPALSLLEAAPETVAATHASVLPLLLDITAYLAAVRDDASVGPFLITLPTVARRLRSPEALNAWMRLIRRMVIEARDGLVPLLGVADHLLHRLGIDGVLAWADNGIETYRDYAFQLHDYFGLRSADAHAMMQRQRHGTLFADVERQLGLTLRALWGQKPAFHPHPVAFGTLAQQAAPHLDKLGMHLPDLLDDQDGVAGIDRYRATVAHLAAHRLWTRPLLADNFSPFQHLAIELFEDARVEALAIGHHPGLRRLWLALHPDPKPGACPPGWSCIRHRLTMLSRRLLDPRHDCPDPLLEHYAGLFHAQFAAAPHDPRLAADLGVHLLKEIHHPDFHSPRLWFEDTVVGYRDDNRYLWHFLEDASRPTDFHSDHGTADPPEAPSQPGVMPPLHYPEWDHVRKTYHPDWVSVHEAIQAPGDAAAIAALPARDTVVAKRLQGVIDRLRPQQRRRERHRPDGDDIDLDRLVTARIDLCAGSVPDGRVYQSVRHHDRTLAVLLLLDLSDSLGRQPPGAPSSLLRLAQESVVLLGWAVEALGDPFAVAGFASTSRHDVRFLHHKGFDEPFGPAVMARLAGMRAGASTRMGAALRHAGARLLARREDMKLLLLLSDGRPADIDVDDPAHLTHDAHRAVTELRAAGVVPFCIGLDPEAEKDTAAIFGPAGYAMVDRLDRLPERMTRLFLSLVA
ncbi:MAG: VWA domain-containing protein [Magnetospirillum sp.]|nr:MAG: VWA domain-containing protein [Magnetospirillum sp.]